MAERKTPATKLSVSINVKSYLINQTQCVTVVPIRLKTFSSFSNHCIPTA